MTEPTSWPQAVAAVGVVMFAVFVVSLFVPLPWLILGHWVEERAKTKRILAEARLLEARRALPPSEKGDGHE